MQKKNRSISKGVIEAKDKQDLYKNNQHFSPNMSKRTVGINLNTFLSSKPGVSKEELELIQSENFRNTNYNMSFHPNNTNNSSMMGTNFQKYSKNITVNPTKNPMLSSQLSGISNSNINNSNAFVTPFPQKNMKLDSIKNINTVIKKLKGPNPSTKIMNKSDVNKLGNQISSSIQKKVPAIPTFSSQNMNNTRKDPIPSISMKSTAYGQQLYPQNLSEMSPSNSLANVNDIYQSKSINSNNQSQNQQGYGFFNSNSSNQKNLFKPQFEEINLNNNLSRQNLIGQSMNDMTKTPEHKKHSTQETKDNSSNNSTIKGYKHSNSNSINGIQLQVNNQVKQANIENPEDLHFFYVKMFQSNKEFAYKFEKEE